MTDIGDKVLDDLHREAVRYMETGNYARSRRVMVSDRDKAITALRARVKEWWDYCDELQQRNDELQVALGWAKTEARQVTREQRNAAIAIAIGKAKQVEGAATYGQVFDWFAEQLGLEIVEEAPKAEGPECGCEAEYIGNGDHVHFVGFVCEKTGVTLQNRCTITEGERDE